MRPDKAKVGCEVRVPAWVPQAARSAILELFDSPMAITDEDRTLLVRLAINKSMKPEVWKKLPSNSEISKGQIIKWAFPPYTILIHCDGRSRKQQPMLSSGQSTNQNTRH